MMENDTLYRLLFRQQRQIFCSENHLHWGQSIKDKAKYDNMHVLYSSSWSVYIMYSFSLSSLNLIVLTLFLPQQNILSIGESLVLHCCLCQFKTKIAQPWSPPSPCHAFPSSQPSSSAFPLNPPLCLPVPSFNEGIGVLAVIGLITATCYRWLQIIRIIFINYMSFIKFCLIFFENHKQGSLTKKMKLAKATINCDLYFWRTELTVIWSTAAG